MDRRSFIIRSVVGGIAAGSILKFGKLGNIFANRLTFPANDYDLVAVKGGEPDVMFDKAIESLGGMKRFVKKGQKVVVKPNIGWNAAPERGANTNPKLIARIIQHCFDAGAKDVYVFDHTCDDWSESYQVSGIEKAVNDSGGKIVPGNDEKYYRDVKVKDGKRLNEAKMHELILDSDVFINVPILKNHNSAKVTASMKNLMGIVWDRKYWHKNDLHQCIADMVTFRKPDLNVVDAYYVLKQHGPRGVSVDDVVTMKSLIVSTDIVAADTAAVKLYGVEPESISYINIAADMKLGRMDLEKLNINRIKLN
jgi:uncharacterized protein (DUF362 family)